MPTRADHATVSRPTTATAPGIGAPTRQAVGIAVAIAVLALVVIAAWLTVTGPEAGTAPAADAGTSSTSGADDVPLEQRARNRGVFE